MKIDVQTNNGEGKIFYRSNWLSGWIKRHLVTTVWLFLLKNSFLGKGYSQITFPRETRNATRKLETWETQKKISVAELSFRVSQVPNLLVAFPFIFPRKSSKILMVNQNFLRYKWNGFYVFCSILEPSYWLLRNKKISPPNQPIGMLQIEKTST